MKEGLQAKTEALATPYGFAMGALGLKLYPWQADVLAALDPPKASVALKAANGSGKSSKVGVCAALWNAAVFPGSLTIVTASVFRQVKEQFFPAVRSLAHVFPGWKFLDTEVESPTGSRIYGFSTDDAGRFEGWHNENLMMICDEAKSIPGPIFDSIERCQPTRLLLMSSPGPAMGRFYEAFTRHKEYFRTFSVTAYDCPHLSAEWISKQLQKYGESSPLVRSMILAEFEKDGQDGTLIPLRHLEACIENPPEFIDGKVYAFCDFAAGGDENVLAVSRGNRVEVVHAWRDRNTMAAVGKFIRLFRKEGLNPEQVSGDGSGLGKPICDRLRELGWSIYPVNNGQRAKDPRHYVDRGTEIWAAGARQIENRAVILPQDDALIAQLSTRRAALNSRGQLQLESKPHLRSRGIPSPDRADAILGAMFGFQKPQLLLA